MAISLAMQPTYKRSSTYIDSRTLLKKWGDPDLCARFFDGAKPRQCINSSNALREPPKGARHSATQLGDTTFRRSVDALELLSGKPSPAAGMGKACGAS